MAIAKIMDKIKLIRESNINYISLFFFLLGSQLFVTHWLRLAVLFIPLVKWKKALTPGFVLLVIFSFSAYQKEYFASFEFAQSTITVPAIIVLLLSYLLGLSITGYQRSDLFNERKIFYLLVGYIIGNALAIIYSYLVLKQDNPLTTTGMFVFYDTMYNLHNIRGGRLISTVASYSLILISAILPLLLINFKEFKKRGFRYTELLFFLVITLFSIYLTVVMGRRTLFVLLMVSFFYVGIVYLLKTNLKNNTKNILFFTIIAIFVLLPLYYYFLQDTLFVRRLDLNHALHDKRFSWWIPSLKSMMAHPFGGGYADCLMPTGPCFRSAHNTWLDIGKSNGVVAFVSLILFHLMHIRYYIRIFKNEEVSVFIKNLIAVITIGMLMIMMIEPIFRAQKTLFFYSVFFLGFLKSYSDFYDRT